ncbi:hypothetical protein [Phaeospirillum tilakii]|uniref:Uncharacterized protein n=1 Tax=Phaeospirillum tilakii TaxID=741673 RepID=A0ABW5C7V4_9PROT
MPRRPTICDLERRFDGPIDPALLPAPSRADDLGSRIATWTRHVERDRRILAQVGARGGDTTNAEADLACSQRHLATLLGALDAIEGRLAAE